MRKPRLSPKFKLNPNRFSTRLYVVYSQNNPDKYENWNPVIIQYYGPNGTGFVEFRDYASDGYILNIDTNGRILKLNKTVWN